MRNDVLMAAFFSRRTRGIGLTSWSRVRTRAITALPPLPRLWERSIFFLTFFPYEISSSSSDVNKFNFLLENQHLDARGGKLFSTWLVRRCLQCNCGSEKRMDISKNGDNDSRQIRSNCTSMLQNDTAQGVLETLPEYYAHTMVYIWVAPILILIGTVGMKYANVLRFTHIHK